MWRAIYCYIHLFFNYSLKLTADQRVVSVVWLQQEKKTTTTKQHQKLIMTRVRCKRPIFQKAAIAPCRKDTNSIIYLVYVRFNIVKSMFTCRDDMRREYGEGQTNECVLPSIYVSLYDVYGCRSITYLRGKRWDESYKITEQPLEMMNASSPRCFGNNHKQLFDLPQA